MVVARSILREKPSAQIRYRLHSGWPHTALGSLRRCVGAHSRRFFHCKIGITNNPDRRWREAYRPMGWHAMHVIYSSRSHRHVCQLEKALIQRFFERDEHLRYLYYNCVGGGGGPKPTCGPYYLYLVTAKKFARLD
jgi:hypothetical protein